MKKSIVLVLGMIIAIMSFTLTACTKIVTVSFDTDGGSVIEAVTMDEGQTLSEPSDPTKDGYDFVGWQLDGVDFDFSSQITKDITLKAVWTPSANTAYTVKHLQQNLNNDNFTLKETEDKRGTTGAQTEAVAKPYQGFTAEEITQKTIEGDGSTVVEIRYTRNVYKITFKTADGEIISEENYKFNAEVIAPEHSSEVGYDFTWDKEIVKATEEAVYTEIKTAAYVNYQVEIYLQNVDGTYGNVASEVSTLSAQMGSQVAVDAPELVGFTFDENNVNNVLEGTVTTDLALKLYFTRNTVTYRYLDAHGDEIFQLPNVKYGDENAVGCPYTPIKVDSLQHAYNFEGWYETENALNEIICSPKYSYEGKMVDFSNATLSNDADFKTSYDAVNDVYNFGFAIPSDLAGTIQWKDTGVKIEDLDYSKYDTIAIKYRAEINIDYVANVYGRLFLSWEGVDLVLQPEIIKAPGFKYLVITGEDYDKFVENIDAIKQANLKMGFFQTAAIQIAEMFVANFATANIPADFVDMANADIYKAADAYRLSTWDYENGVYELFNKKNFSYQGACWAPFGNHPINPIAAYEKASKFYVNLKGPVGTNVYIGTRSDNAQGSTALHITLTSDEWTEYVIEGEQLFSFVFEHIPFIMEDWGGLQFAHDSENQSVYFGAMYFVGEKEVSAKNYHFINFEKASVYGESDPYRLSSVINDGKGYKLESKNCFGAQGACWAPLGVHPSIATSAFKYASKMVVRAKGESGATLFLGTREDGQQGATALKIALTSNEYQDYVVEGEALKAFVEEHLPFMMKDVGGLQIGYNKVGVVEIEEIYFEFTAGGAEGSYEIANPKVPVIDTALVDMKRFTVYSGDPYRIANYDAANDAFYFKAIAFVHVIDGKQGIWAPTNRDIVPEDVTNSYNALRIKLKGTVGSTFYFGNRNSANNIKIDVESEEYQEYIFAGYQLEEFLKAYRESDLSNNFFEIGATTLNAEIWIREIELTNVPESELPVKPVEPEIEVIDPAEGDDFIDLSKMTYVYADGYRLGGYNSKTNTVDLKVVGTVHQIDGKAGVWAPLYINPVTGDVAKTYAQVIIKAKASVGSEWYFGSRNQDGSLLKINVTEEGWVEYVFTGADLTAFFNAYYSAAVGTEGLELGCITVGAEISIRSITLLGEAEQLPDEPVVPDEPEEPEVVDAAEGDNFLDLSKYYTYASTDAYRLGSYDATTQTYTLKIKGTVHNVDGKAGVWAGSYLDTLDKTDASGYTKFIIKAKATVGSEWYFGSRKIGASSLKVNVTEEGWVEYVFTGEELTNFLNAYYSAEMGTESFEIFGMTVNAEICIRSITLAPVKGHEEASAGDNFVELSSSTYVYNDAYRVGGYNATTLTFDMKVVGRPHTIDGKAGVWAPTYVAPVAEEVAKGYTKLIIKAKATAGSEWYFGSRNQDGSLLKINVTEEGWVEYEFTGEALTNFLNAYYSAEMGTEHFEIGCMTVGAKINIRSITLTNE